MRIWGEPMMWPDERFDCALKGELGEYERAQPYRHSLINPQLRSCMSRKTARYAENMMAHDSHRLQRRDEEGDLVEAFEEEDLLGFAEWLVERCEQLSDELQDTNEYFQMRWRERCAAMRMLGEERAREVQRDCDREWAASGRNEYRASDDYGCLRPEFVFEFDRDSDHESR